MSAAQRQMEMVIMRKSFAFGLLALAVVVFGGCETSEESCCEENARTSADRPVVEPGILVNKKCPMTGEELAPNPVTADYQGKKVGFCCAGCVTKWSKLTPSEMDAKLKAN